MGQRASGSLERAPREYRYFAERRPLTSRLQVVYDFIVQFEDQRDRMPTIDEVRVQFGKRRRCEARDLMHELAGRGWLGRYYEKHTVCFYLLGDGDDLESKVKGKGAARKR